MTHCRSTLRHLVRHCHLQSKLPAVISSCNSRRFTCLATCNSSSSKYINSLQQRLVASSRCYSKFSTHLNSERAMELLCNLDEDERLNLRDAMYKLEADLVKKQFEMEAAEPPTARQLYSIFFVNAVPFVAFGFLDNFIMITAGEYIESSLGHFITLSTMAAAGLGNTISDIMGITMATYVEEGCQLLGLKQPRMTPAQFELKSSRRASSWGRIMGITVGCLIGMCPLWLIKDEPKPTAEN
ncbi:transmembrane protein 65 isoform X2 [Drosophila novamexicana]|uniref:transmembrane protein 65 isoform X2 n=1 Tax=Drosophila novamexicana TaxID=47314 RepID=UPI0011E5F062|nr:transmembrane protein 65 isoform X2 [Drosophila novamexicana]